MLVAQIVYGCLQPRFEFLFRKLFRPEFDFVLFILFDSGAFFWSHNKSSLAGSGTVWIPYLLVPFFLVIHTPTIKSTARIIFSARLKSQASPAKREGGIMMLDQALEIVTERYGWRSTYVTTAGQVVYVVGAEKELGPIPGVLPRSGIGLLAPE